MNQTNINSAALSLTRRSTPMQQDRSKIMLYFVIKFVIVGLVDSSI